jgi:hypothetical protein
MPRRPQPSLPALLDGTCALVRQALPALEHGATEDLVLRATSGNGAALGQVMNFLLAHPDGFTTGVSDAPPAVGRLIQALLELGVEGVRAPRCLDCQRGVALRVRVEGGRVCRSCYRNRHRKVCCRCGRLDKVQQRVPGGVLCPRCYRQENRAQCARCGGWWPVAARTPQGEPLCQTCRPGRKAPCVGCGRDAPVAHRGESGPLCSRCHGPRRRPRRPCGRCGQTRPVALPGTADRPDLCSGCRFGPLQTCHACGRDRPCRQGLHGAPTCRQCQRPRRTCAACRREVPIAAVWPLGSVCSDCYRRIREHPAACAGCGNTRILVGHDENRGGLCGPCVGFDVLWGCSACPSTAGAYEGGRCARCVMIDQVRQLLAGPDGDVPAQLQPLLAAFAAVEEPRTVLAWVRRSSGARAISQLAATATAVDHAALDALPQTQALNYLRQALVFSGVLSERSEYLERLVPWLDQLVVGQPAHRARLIQSFARWDVLRRARARARRREFTHGAAKGVHAKIRASLEFLTWIDNRDQTLGELAQPDVEQWLQTHPGTRAYLICDFLRWARNRGLIGPVSIKRSSPADPAYFVDDDERWRLLRRCLDDQSLALVARTAGSLMLIYGLSVSQLVRLTAGDVVQRDGDTFLRIDRQLPLLPPKLAALVIAQRDHGRIPSALGRADPQTHWLFSGVHPGRPLTSTGLRRTLAELGVHLRAARNTALMTLAEDLPASILAELLGLNIGTAVRWTKLAQRDWTDYLAVRAHTRQITPDTGELAAPAPDAQPVED